MCVCVCVFKEVLLLFRMHILRVKTVFPHCQDSYLYSSQEQLESFTRPDNQTLISPET